MKIGTTNRNFLKFGILCVAMTNGGNMPLVPALGAIKEAMPDVSLPLIQSLLSVQCLFIAFAPMWYAKLLEILPKRRIMQFGMMIFLIGGIMPYFLHQNIWIMLIFRALVGTGNGLCMLLSMDLVVDFFDDHERDSMQGVLSAVANVTGVIYQLIAGYLIQFGWRYAFLTFSLGSIYLILATIIVPEPNRKGKIKAMEGAEDIRAKLNPKVFLFSAVTVLFFIAWMSAFNNMSFTLTTEKLGTAWQIGLVTSCASLGGLILALCFGFIQERMHHNSITLSYILSAAGLFVLYFSHHLVPFACGAALIGMALGIIVPAQITKVTEMVPYSAAPKAIASITFSLGVGQFLQPIVFSFLGEHGQGREGFLAAGIMTVLLIGLIIIVLKITSQKG
ncbi:MAG: MFS transporter [Clostridiales Family XIII bacterium]|nr:MFS transporter [Clostridiales Family XIII bacterium]